MYFGFFFDFSSQVYTSKIYLDNTLVLFTPWLHYVLLLGIWFEECWRNEWNVLNSSTACIKWCDAFNVCWQMKFKLDDFANLGKITKWLDRCHFVVDSLNLSNFRTNICRLHFSRPILVVQKSSNSSRKNLLKLVYLYVHSKLGFADPFISWRMPSKGFVHSPCGLFIL